MPSYLLDTNVIGELVRAVPDGRVIRWVARRMPLDLHLSAVTLGELIRGISRLPGGKRRRTLLRWVNDDVRIRFAGRILPFDEEAGVLWGTIMGRCDRRGRPRAAADAQIAAIALRFGLTLVTRNTDDFRGMPVTVVNPWM